MDLFIHGREESFILAAWKFKSLFLKKNYFIFIEKQTVQVWKIRIIFSLLKNKIKYKHLFIKYLDFSWTGSTESLTNFYQV